MRFIATKRCSPSVCARHFAHLRHGAQTTWLFVVFVLLVCEFSAQLGDRLAIITNVDAVRVGVSEAFSQGDCETTLYSSDNYLKCTFDLQLVPNTTQDVSDLIKLHTNSSNSRIKIRATRRGFHSSAGFVCSGRRSSSKKERVEFGDDHGRRSLRVTSYTMLLHVMNHVVSVDAEQHKLTVEAGMTLLELARVAEANGMAVPAGALSMYGNLTVGGVIMASAHGSGLGTVSSLGDLVTKIKWVNAKGEIIVSDLQTERGAKEVRALVGGLGLLGVVTEFTLKLQPNSRTIVDTRKGLDDTNLVLDLKKTLALETPHIIVHWRPDFESYKALLFTQVDDVNQSAAAVIPKYYPNARRASDIPVSDKMASAWSELMATWEDDAAEELPSADVLNTEICSWGESTHRMSMFLDIDGTPIDHGMFRTNSAILTVGSVGADVKSIVKTELDEVEARLRMRHGVGRVKRCLPPGYFWLRFGQGNRNLLSTAVGSEDVVYVQWTFLHSALIPNKLAKQSTIAETLEQLTLCKYQGRPHWGKNHERVFRHPDCKVVDNFPAANIAQLLEMQRQHDPEKIFEPELFNDLLQRTGPEYSPLCTAHFWCYCRDDSHCPHGHKCRPSPLFLEYKICKLVQTTNHQQHAEL
ncbi:L-gulonolactone oxidase 2 [Physcomitrium patens]|uniref:L-gulonolactone oxidase 2 n=1 Tax=Physcomitrium patens TaxID=3218 RepID=UPI003CCD6B10